mmetsp:Transcript_9828/g.16318  ORF Transcript_9828/g.16318 Transcript_9828/m.16318 type:complete len:114 (+) Transcript_9828:69-410(+)|eukprot:CAMPEP_0119012270 /NCGR_PEP_ID=MMETSP1176-20130426/6185_1 /TAXON_ID=265551 /ORGANISM="Synedropsis recta cf, Strain CCMP1620" /LENGTH=113 /DNA_ID=CAMNT_0006965191 /DNA_START=60 /DNA_END=401 /DNA_ORIENTATION=+
MSNNMALAQLMKDMQDPEMMKEAQAMMQSPAFQAQMKKMSQNPNFKQAMQGTKKMMEDPEKMKEMEGKMKSQLAEGQKQLEAAEKAKAEAGGDAKPSAEEDGDELVVPNLGIN